MAFYRKLGGGGFLAVMELVLVLAVLGVVATIVGPRVSRAANSPRTGEQVLVGHLRALRTAIVAYAADHNGRWPEGDAARITAQLTQFSDRSGDVSVTRSRRYGFGPYLRDIPRLPVGIRAGTAVLGVWPDGGAAGWIYDPGSGRIWANTWPGEFDGTGRGYSTY